MTNISTLPGLSVPIGPPEVTVRGGRRIVTTTTHGSSVPVPTLVVRDQHDGDAMYAVRRHLCALLGLHRQGRVELPRRPRRTGGPE